ncbi:iron-containing alcohol dehydrogenase, partial [candidate division KSB3 bacterium]|nr:iron-containing alcohol dehydrogenase [candidate division KSB3 bacterium]MBD3325555.1 iron-containing alcohol dehydrogenase [candidate division KSB3 bacterium]
LKPRIEALLGAEFDAVFTSFAGESTEAEMQQGAQTAKEKGCAVVIGVGGGKAIDTAKGIAHFTPGTKLVVVPTIVASDAPCSKNAVVYNPDHTVNRDLHGLFNPDIVLVDSDIVAHAPSRYLAAGIADALATWFEAESVQKTLIPNFTGYSGTLTAFTIAKLCFETIMTYGRLAMMHCEQQIVTPQLEAVIEANTLMSTVGFESGGLGAAHGFHQGIAEWEETHSLLHGEKVAFGTLASLMLTNRPPELIEETYALCYDIGLPVCLADLGIKEYDDDYLMIAVNRMMLPVECTHNEPVKYSAQDYLAAMKAADQYGRAFKQASAEE